jgi:hypothetical protein
MSTELAVQSLETLQLRCNQMLPLKSSLPRFRITQIGWVIGSVPLLLVMYWLLGNPNASFRSSDSNWASHEILWKGLDFERMAFGFEGYRIKCQADSAQLVRTTKMLWWNVFAWPSYMTDPKWNVPYGEPDERIGSNSPRGFSGFSSHDCARRGFKGDEIALIMERSAALIRHYGGGT